MSSSRCNCLIWRGEGSDMDSVRCASMKAVDSEFCYWHGKVFNLGSPPAPRDTLEYTENPIVMYTDIEGKQKVVVEYEETVTDYSEDGN